MASHPMGGYSMNQTMNQSHNSNMHRANAQHQANNQSNNQTMHHHPSPQQVAYMDRQKAQMTTVLNCMTQGGQRLHQMDSNDAMQVHLMNAQFLQQLAATRRSNNGQKSTNQFIPQPLAQMQPKL